MKKLIFVFIILSLLVGCSTPAIKPTENPPSFAFGIPDWLNFGMKEDDVRKHYNIEPSSFGDRIGYSCVALHEQYKDLEWYQAEYDIWYGFSYDNKLTLLSYDISFDPSITDSINPVEKRPYISEYEWLKGEISKSFGEPIQSSPQWINDKYKDDEKMINHAIERCDYIIITTWLKDGIYVSLSFIKRITINYTIDKYLWLTPID